MINCIVCISEETNGISSKGKLLYDIPEDMRSFKELTWDNTVVMGYNTWCSLPEKVRPLRSRKNIVMSRKPNLIIHGVRVVNSVDDISDLNNMYPEEKIFVIGGQEIYDLFMDHYDKLYITKVGKKSVNVADRFFNLKNIVNYDLKKKTLLNLDYEAYLYEYERVLKK